MSEIRLDKSSEISSVLVTDEGYLEIVAPVARVGVYKYRRKDGSVQRELVPATTLFEDKSKNSLKMKPVTKTHPNEFVSTKAFRKLSVGSVGETLTESDNFLYAKFIVSAEDAIIAIQNGSLRQLSPAYTCEVVEKSGITENGEEYDCVQVNRRYNHLALVSKARGGDDLEIRLDGCDSLEVEEFPDNNNKELCMPTLRIDGIDYTIENPVVATHISTLTVKAEKADALQSELNIEKGNVTTLQAKYDALEAKIATMKPSEEVIQKRVDARIELLTKAEKVLGVGVIKADQSDLDVMKAVITKITPTAKFDGYEGDHLGIYVKARFDACLETKADAGITQQRKATSKINNDSKEETRTPEQKRKDSLESKWETGSK